MEDIIINVSIPIIVIIGFFIFYGRSNGWFKEGGLVYEWWKNRKNKKGEK